MSQAPRFASDPILKACLGGSHVMMLGETGPAVRKVQEALIDLGYPPLLGANSTFGADTAAAVALFQTAKTIAINGTVDKPTMGALDGDCIDKPPAPFSDRDEWVSWGKRAAVPSVGVFNFTRADELARRAAGLPFTFDVNSAWLPAAFQEALAKGFAALLDSAGSPTPSWGAGPFDLDHCHVGLWINGGLLIPQAVQDAQTPLNNRLAQLLTQASGTPGAVYGDALWSDAYRAAYLASDVMTRGKALANACLAAATATQPLYIIWHTFEHDRWRPATMVASDPERSWQTPLAPVLAPIFPFPHPPGTYSNIVSTVFSIGFVISKTRVITAVPTSSAEAFCVAGLVRNAVTDLWV